MRHPGLAICGALVVLVVLVLPMRQIHFDVPHDDVLQSSAPSSRATHELQERFGIAVTAPIVVVLATNDPAKVQSASEQVLGLTGVASVAVAGTDAKEPGAALLVNSKRDPQGGPHARAVVDDIRALDLPGGVRVGGQAAGEIEFLAAVTHGIPLTLACVFLTTFLVLAVAFRSVTLPLKAILLDSLSILASLGAVVGVFQLGNFADLFGVVPLGYTESTMPIILFCVLFGLSMDYEVFMLAQVTELYQQGLDAREATARGVASTAPLVTGAALILVVIGVSFATTQLVLVKQVGFGMATALALDATLVRFVLLPATMRYLGEANWWMPDALLRRIPRTSWAH